METTNDNFGITLLLLAIALSIALLIIWITRLMRKKIEPTNTLSYHEALHEVYRCWDIIEDTRIKCQILNDTHGTKTIEQVQGILKELEIYFQAKMGVPEHKKELQRLNLPLKEYPTHFTQPIATKDVRTETHQ